MRWVRQLFTPKVAADTTDYRRLLVLTIKGVSKERKFLFVPVRPGDTDWAGWASAMLEALPKND